MTEQRIAVGRPSHSHWMTILSTKLKNIHPELSGKSNILRIGEITTKIELFKVEYNPVVISAALHVLIGKV